MRVAQNLAKLSSCLSLCLLLISRAKRGGGGSTDDLQQRRRRRRKGGKGDNNSSRELIKEEMEGLIGTLPVVLQKPEQGDEELQGEIWGNLPDELQDRVLACLPVPLLLQFRSVCKRWNSLVTSTSFLKLRAESPYSGPHFLVFESQKPESWGAYDPSLHKWYHIPLKDLEHETIISMACDGGLICAVIRSSWDAGPTRLVLCNPVTRCMRQLPMTLVSSLKAPYWIPSLVVLVVDQARNSFKVIAAGFNGCPHLPTCLCKVTEVYDSVSDSWETTGNLPGGSIEFLGPPSHAVCGGLIYCIATYRGELQLVAYDLERKVWKQISVQMPDLLGNEVLLYERRGFLVLVQQAHSVFGVPEIYTWQPGPHPVASQWTKMRTLLPRIGRRFEELFQFDEDLVWVGHGDQIFFVSHKWGRALLYDLLQKTWTITPGGQFLKLDCPGIMAIPFDFNLRLLSD